MLDCAIVGAGPSGLMLAVLLARSGRTVRVLERQSGLEPPAGGVVLQPATLGFLNRVGMLDALQDGGTAIVGIDETGPEGPLFSGDYALLSETPSPWALAIPLRLIRAQLLDMLDAEPNASLQTGAEVVGLEQSSDACRVDVSTGPVVASYVVGADGKYSTVRKACGLTGEVVPFADRQLIARAPRPDGWPARVRSHRSDRPVVMIPSGSRTLHIFGAVESDDTGTAFGELVDRVDTVYPDLATLMRSDGQPVALIRHHTVELPRWTDGRVVLIGDSAHSVHPYGGQGMNLGLQDAALLATVLDQALAADNCPPVYSPADGRAVLPEFEAVRRPFIERFQARQRELLSAETTEQPFYVTDFADLALGQRALRPLFAAPARDTARRP